MNAAVADAPHRRPRRCTTAGRRATRPRRTRRASRPRCTRRGRRPPDEPVPRTSTRHKRVAAGREPLAARRVRVAPPVVLAVRDHLEDRREPLVRVVVRRARPPDVGRQLDAVARRDPGVPVDVDLVARSAGGRRRGSAGRSSRASLRAASRRADAAARAVRRCRPWTTSRVANGPWTRRSRRVAYENPWITVWHDEVTRPDGSPGSTASSTSPTWRPGSSPSTTRIGSCSSASTATRSTRTRGRSPRAACPTARTALDGRPARAARGDRRRGRPSGASSPGVAPVELGHRRARRACSWRPGLTHGDATPGRHRGAGGPLGAVRRGAGDDPRRPDHRRDERRSRSSGVALRPARRRGCRDRRDRRDWDVIVVGLGAIGSGAAYWARPGAGARVLGLERFEFGHANGASADHSRIIRLSYHRPDYVRLAKRAYETWAEVEAEAGERIVTITGGLDLWPADAGHPAGRLHRAAWPPRACRSSCSTRAEVMRRWPQWHLDRRRDRDVAGAGRPGRPVSRATPRTGGWRRRAARRSRPHAGDGHPRRAAASSRSTPAGRPIGAAGSSWPPTPGRTGCWRRSAGACR